MCGRAAVATTAGALGLLVVPSRRDALLRTVLRPRLLAASGPPPVVAETHREWLDEQAAGMQRRLRRGGYPVVGDPDALLPRWPDLPARNEQPPQVLSLALDLLLRPLADGGGAAR